MVKEINGSGINRPALQNETTTARSAGRPAAQEVAPNASSSTRAVSDSVSLSSNAQALKSGSATLQKLPDVNEKRVAEIRAALQSGQYKVDDLVVADKLLEADDLFQ